MLDYEELILERQDMLEIYEDDPDIYESLLNGSWWDDIDDALFIEVRP